ncbi:MAG: hypothetical protein JWL85_270 [Candidatus Saccharibacteria bacterium]|nr:hypothetical protein [Candidatus Saccharibacteria bacterium]
MSDAYKNAGVNLVLGDELSEALYTGAVETWPNRDGSFGELVSAQRSFSGMRALAVRSLLDVPNPEGLMLHMGDDGIGTKVEIAGRVRDHSTMAFDLLAMVCDDAAIKGFEPAAVTTTFDVRKLHESMRPDIEDLVRGYVAAAKAANVAIVNGEVAELGPLVGGYDGPGGLKGVVQLALNALMRREPVERLRYNWSATVIAAGHEQRLLDGSQVTPGDSLVAFREHGLRSNGLSLVRKVLREAYGREWHNTPHDGSTLGRMVLKPSIIYSQVLVDAIGGYDLRRQPRAEVHGAAHITGGGIPGKLGRLLKATGFGADIEAPFAPPEIMDLVQRAGNVPDEEIYRILNMGNGMIVATPDPSRMIELVGEHGMEAKVIGTVTKETSNITIKSAGVMTPGVKLVYAAA